MVLIDDESLEFINGRRRLKKKKTIDSYDDFSSFGEKKIKREKQIITKTIILSFAT